MNAVFQDPQPILGRFVHERGFPDNYFIFDLETSGFSREHDVITQVGWAIIRGRRIVDNQSLTLNWTRHPGMDHSWLDQRLRKLADAFAKQGKPYRLTYQELANSPHDPIACLNVLDTLIDAAIQSNEWIIGHNLAMFDTSMVDAHRRRFLDEGPVLWEPNGIFDTGLFLKAAQLGNYPGPGETLNSFFRKTASIRAKGVLWALDSYCIPTFGLATRFGVDVSACHDAGYDCKVNHHLFEVMREIGCAYRRVDGNGEIHGQKESDPVQGRFF